MKTYNFGSLLDGVTFVFVGQNATTGSPNPITGRLSYWGEFIGFKRRDDAKRYVDEFRSNGFDFVVMGTYRTLRKYKLGSSVYHYLESLCFCPILSYDENGRLI